MVGASGLVKASGGGGRSMGGWSESMQSVRSRKMG